MTELQPRYTNTGNWYKGNTHVHSTVSDGGRTFAELASSYADVGYDFLFRTDHWRGSHVAFDPATYPLLWLDGIELDGFDTQSRYFHVVALGTFEGITRDIGFPAALESAREQGGLLILAHPTWSGNTFEDARRWGFHGVEVYNHVCRWLNGKGNGVAHWNGMLEAAQETLAFASDDAHIRPDNPGWNGGWVVAQAPACTPGAIMESLRAGRFYSTMGPEFQHIGVERGSDGTQVRIESSPVRFARLVGPGYLGRRVGDFEGPLMTEAAFDLPEDWPYAYLETEDDRGRRAWTNTLMCGCR